MLSEVSFHHPKFPDLLLLWIKINQRMYLQASIHKFHLALLYLWLNPITLF